jgi:UDP-4-amino-4,6-dideoxy-N-acetyl-beta-L-altrosamine transaminase
MPKNSFLPYGRHSVDEADIAAVAEVLRGDWLTMGPAVRRFEEAFAAVVGARHAVSCSSGTAALHLAAMAAGLGEGYVAIVPTLTFLATANCVRYVGGEVVFADVDPRTGLMEAGHLEAALARAPAGRAKAVLPVHLNGQCGDVERIREVANANGLAVIEDACHALGTTWTGVDGKTSTIGSCARSDMAAFSFHPVKTIAAGEAGAVTTNDERLYRKLALACSHGMTRDAAAFETKDLAFDADGSPNPWYYEMPEFGFNYRLSDIHAALATSQLAKVDKFATRRRSLARRYDELIKPLAPFVQPVARAPGCDPVWHLYVVQIDFAAANISRAMVMNKLRAMGIGTQVHYLPVHLQPYYRKRYGAIDLPGARAYYDRALSLPLFPAMADDDVERVVSTLRECIRTANGAEVGS